MNGNNISFFPSDRNFPFSIQHRKVNWSSFYIELPHISIIRILIISWPWALFGSNFWITFAMSFQLKLMEEITFSLILNKNKESTLELFIGEHWLAKTLLKNSALYLVLYLFQWSSGEIQGIFLLLRNDFKIDQYILVLVEGFINFFKICASG